MEVQDLLNALRFLQKTYVGRGDEDALVKTILALEKELSKKTRTAVAS
jgi:hypothetical protein